MTTRLPDPASTGPRSLAALREIAGVGEARVEKYGDAFLRLLREAFAAPGAAPPEPAGAT